MREVITYAYTGMLVGFGLYLGASVSYGIHQILISLFGWMGL